MGKPSRRRRLGRSGGTPAIKLLPWQNLKNPLPPIEVLSADQVEAIHGASLCVLAEAGMKVTDREARQFLGAAGAQVDHGEDTVRFDPAMVEAYMAHVPAEFTIRARNPGKGVTVGGNYINFAPVGGPSFVSDLDRGRRAGTLAELNDYKKLIQRFDILHLAGVSPFEPLDLPVQTRHLDAYYGAIRYTDKVWSAWLLGAGRARDALDMACLVHGVAFEDLPSQPLVYGNININSPRLLDGPMAQGLITFARARQPVVVTPFTLAGAMAPVTIAGALDAQAAYESEMSLWGAVMGHANLVFHAAGWLEGGLTGSFEKLIVDVEMLQMMAAYLTPMEFNEDALAVAAIEETPPAGHFFGASHTLARYETAFYEPIVSDRRNYETWLESGGRTAAERANAIWKRLLADYEAPPLDAAIDEALRAFMAERAQSPAGSEAIAR
jgi:trimethylamine:corrinoid methyltransferase-like protein